MLILGIILPFVAFAQSWEPENVWDVNNDSNIEVEIIGERCKPLIVKVKFLDYTSINQVFIHYASQDPNYTKIPMSSLTHASNQFVASIPETATQWYYIDYYIEAFNAQNLLVTSTGNAINPTRIFLTGKCPEQVTNPPTVNQPSKQVTNPPEVNQPTNEEDSLNDDIYDEIFAKKTPSASPSFQFSIMLGTGVGIIGDKTENCNGNVKCAPNGGSIIDIDTGAASLPFHLRASAIFNLPKHFQIGAYLRGQLHNIVEDALTPNAKTNVKHPEQYNIMVGLTARYLVLWKQPYRLYIGLELGWGGANATVDMGRNFNNFKDIYLYKGPWHIAPEIGFLWNFHKNVGLAVELTIPIVFPERPSAFFDLSFGPYIQL